MLDLSGRVRGLFFSFHERRSGGVEERRRGGEEERRRGGEEERRGEEEREGGRERERGERGREREGGRGVERRREREGSVLESEEYVDSVRLRLGCAGPSASRWKSGNAARVRHAPAGLSRPSPPPGLLTSFCPGLRPPDHLSPASLAWCL